MKGEKEHIDDIFKERSEQHSFKVPDSFLEDINAKLDVLDQNKKRRGGLWWFALIPLLAIVTYVFWPSENTKKTEPVSSVQDKKLENTKTLIDSSQINSVQKEILKDSNSAVSMVKDMDPENNTIYENDRENIVALKAYLERDQYGKSTQLSGPNWNSKENSSASDTIKKKDSNNDSHPLWIDKEVSENELFPKNNELQSLGSTEIEPHEDNFLVDETKGPIDEVSENSEGAAQMEKKDVDVIVSDDIQDVLIDSSKSTSIEKQEPIETIHEVGKGHDAVSQRIQDDSDSTITIKTPSDPLRNESVSQEDSDSTFQSSQDSVKVEKLISTSKSSNENKKTSHEIQLYSGIMNSSPRVSIGNNPGVLTMTDMETNLWRSSWGLMYRARLKSYDIGVGLNWIQNGEKVNYSTNAMSYMDIDTVTLVGFEIDSIYNPNTQQLEIDSIPIYDSLTINTQVNDSVYFTGKNKYTWVSIPLQFGYRIKWNKFSIIPRVGVDLSFAVGSNTGTYAEINNQGLIQRASNRFIISNVLQMEVRRKFYRMHVFVTPYFRSTITPVITSDIQTRWYYSWGINAGIGFAIK